MDVMGTRSQEHSVIEQLNRRFRPVLMAYFLRRIHNHAEAEDMTQEVFLRLASHPDTDMRSPEAFVFQVAANLLRDRGRRAKVRQDYQNSVSLLDGRGIDPLDPLTIASDRETLSLLKRGIADLPARMRSVFLLCCMDGASRKSLADAYGVSISTIDRDLARALATLTIKIKGEDGQ